MKKFRNGIYEVRITGITHGESSIKKTPFFICRFEGFGRYHEEKVHITENSKKYIKYLYYKAGIKSDKLDGTDLVGAELGINIVTGSRIKDTGEYVTFPKLEKLFTLKEIKELKAERCTYNTKEDDYYEFEDENNDVSVMAEIFGVSIRDVARDMGKDPCQISSGDIMEYSGY